ncbi:hypothetical protein [Tuwongella immobilis]|uniref:Uncharacterized protein n=1 Tax=Tuwongella immobilis TaxID=692036 RepID=A0A6C2YXH7_9BACT|nr:hypothetical protein [Tuwongella immobilis]VIP05579.1 unnamed protein product [Tuwongella immobilis]VTS08513.1 unnamed protein product [Tuwongella immobilis]
MVAGIVPACCVQAHRLLLQHRTLLTVQTSRHHEGSIQVKIKLLQGLEGDRPPEHLREALVAEHAARVEREEPLHPEPRTGKCWCCGIPAPGTASRERRDWHAREFMKGICEREIYCPACFAEWGWPPEE